MKSLLSLKTILTAIALILIDLSVYIFLGLMLMSYDDFYDESKGGYWTLESMGFWQKVNYIGLNFWHFINLLVIAYLLYRLITHRKKVIKV